MSYILGKHSKEELKGVFTPIVHMVTEAIKITNQDFIVFDGLRTMVEQRKNVLRGVSKTYNSFHLYGLAVDLVPYVDGRPQWESKDKAITMKWYNDISTACKTIIQRDKLPIDWGYDLWKWDLPHWQVTKLNGKDARKVYDFRKGGYYGL